MALTSLLILFAFAGASPVEAGRSSVPIERAKTAEPRQDCKDWQACRQLALDAAERKDYEAFHDLAWRTMQAGPKNDGALMLLVARAQSLSGRPHDALVMLQRLATMNFPTDAATSEDFARVRALPGWAELEPKMAGTAAPAAPTPRSAATTAPSATPPAPSSAAPVKPATEKPKPREETPAPPSKPDPVEPTAAKPEKPAADPPAAPASSPKASAGSKAAAAAAPLSFSASGLT